ncbi:MAG: hypothetical protein PVH37_24340 [Desulfobacterales bacterium]|jgi:hypothetical protein
MSNFTKVAAILFFIAILFGCASTGTDQKPTELPSGSLHIEEWQIAAMAEMQWGHGTLGYNGKLYKFKIGGVGAGGTGVQKITATGHAYNLNDIADFAGTYVEARAGITVAKGAGGLWVQNGKKVTLHLKMHAEGLALAIGVDGLTIEME